MSNPDFLGVTSHDIPSRALSRPNWRSQRVMTILLLVLSTTAGTIYWWRFLREPEGNGTATSAAFTDPQKANEAFDLSKSVIPLEEILSGGPPKDGIPAITNPRMIPARDATFLKPTDRVVGVTAGEESRAYPIGILNYHEIVNDSLSNSKYAVTYCPLCDSVAVIDRNTPLGEREFGVSGLLYNSNVLMYDRGGKPESLWSQVKSAGVTGPAADQTLQTLPVELTTWKHWQSLHPETEVMSIETGHRRNYSQSPYEGYFSTPQLMFPVNHKDPRLAAKLPVIGLWTKNSSIAVPLNAFGNADRKVRGQIDELSFSLGYDAESNSVRVLEASLGVQWMYSFWFAWAAFHSKTEILDITRQ